MQVYAYVLGQNLHLKPYNKFNLPPDALRHINLYSRTEPLPCEAMIDGRTFMAIRVLIVDDIEAVRQDLRTLLTLAEGIEVVGEAANGLEAVRKVDTLHPDVLLLDLEMPVLDGYQAASQIKARYPSCRVIALTIHGYPAAQHKALQSGVDVFIVKGTPMETLIEAIKEVQDDH
jgi:CheY-like chemotaxis protein